MLVRTDQRNNEAAPGVVSESYEVCMSESVAMLWLSTVSAKGGALASTSTHRDRENWSIGGMA